ncbi:molybdenum cofactor biosynthesis protein [Aquimarina aggregata]|uniref:Molybdopterin molybdenumtransferase n=1 Tax=Aquimarina aggregata TaxID=1642818 RepID=A0A162F9T2_9FLAO|nr:gephyrin-like molybdotransferase Glp [Aquimarina aggregata]KZS40026.1 molybdenum cofactor biosynthesis protein [Aquimarina aggregata]
MISVQQALQFTKNHTKTTPKTIPLPLSESLGFIIAKDITSPISMPPFRQSAMDGYALGSIDDMTFKLIGEVKAGDEKEILLHKGEAIRIFTGAPVPKTAKAVIMQEKVTVSNITITLQETARLHSNIRPAGEQIEKGDIALSKGTEITPAGIGYLASLGITTITVYQKPTIAIIATGNELVPPGQTLAHGQIYESNSVMLAATLAKSGFTDIVTHKVADDYEATRQLLDQMINTHDVVLISGGISVGDYDFVGKALGALNVKEVFYKVKQKPGKPLYFAKKEDKTIFALPGNPASSLSCFYIYVLPSLLKISGYRNYELSWRTVISDSEYTKKGQRAEFLKAHMENEKVTILDGQASSMLRSFALANAIVYLPEDISKVHVGDTVQVINLP